MFEDPWPERTSRIKSTALFLVPLLLVGAVGFRYLTTATPLSATEAVEVFRAEKKQARGDSTTGPSASRSRPEARAGTSGNRPASARMSRTARTRDRGRGTRIAATPRRREQRQQTRGARVGSGADERAKARWQPGRPMEGAYSWDTEGYESFNGARRQFPEETHRIVTHESRSRWMSHHVFSKEREAWTRVQATKEGYFAVYARNRVVFGPVTRDSEVTFDPPMLTNPMTRVGAEWTGRWDGKTYGTYAGRILDGGVMKIDGKRIEVLELEFEMEMHGEVEGTSAMRFWVSGEHHMVVREHYRQDVKSGGAEYHAEWDMTVESLTPRR